MAKQTCWNWILVDDYNDVINHGISMCDKEVLLGDILEFDSGIDRDLCDIQKYLDSYHAPKGYRFLYKEIQIDFDDLLEEV